MPQSSSTYRAAPAATALIGLVVVAIAALALAGPGAAATPCGEAIVADWFDNGRVDRLYDLDCYDAAMDAIPSDLRDYTDAEEVITRALQAAAGGRLAQGGVDPTPEDSPNDRRTLPDPGNPTDPGLRPEAIPDVDTSAPSSVPVPLLVLGGMCLALLAAGGLGYASRRRRAQDGPDDEHPAG